MVMQVMRYEDAPAYQFSDLWVRELSPDAMQAGSLAEIVLPIGVERPPRRSQKKDRVYVGISGEVEFTVEGSRVHIRRGDVIHIAEGEEYGYFNGGQQEARLLLFRSPAPSPPEES
jgi:mannose-6-phosphate isomerase-like protein (cupin superfamily)|nr:cupin domain-containing protein [Acidimicrobiia bacterium]